LQVDAKPTRDALGWTPPIAAEAALIATARAYLDENPGARGGV
jgi:hypothetical protein